MPSLFSGSNRLVYWNSESGVKSGLNYLKYVVISTLNVSGSLISKLILKALYSGDLLNSCVLVVTTINYGDIRCLVVNRALL